MLVAFIILGKNGNNSKPIEKTDAEKFASEYTLVTEENVFVYKDIDEILDVLENGTGVVYFGFPECPWCQSYVVMLNEVAKEVKLDKIYYFNIKEDRENNTEKYQKIVNLLKGYLFKDNEGNDRVMVPDITFVKDGKIIGHNNETSNLSGDPNEYWTAEKKLELKTELTKLINEVNEKICTSCNE